VTNWRRWLIVACSALLFCLPCVGQGIASWTMEKSASGVVLLFAQPVTLDGVRLPVRAVELWGPGRRGTVAALKSDHAVGIAVPDIPDQTLFGVISDASASRLDITPVYAEIEEPASGSGVGSSADLLDRIKVLGTSAEQRRLEVLLSQNLQEEVEWQRRRGCFSCHRLLPLGLAVQSAVEQKIALPHDSVRELLQNLTDWQSGDGSWFFPRASRYGRVTATLTALAVLGWWEEITTTDGSASLLRGLGFLAGVQREDGGVAFDFTYPPVFHGRAAAGWLMLNGLVFGRREVERAGHAFPSRFVEMQMRLCEWFAQVEDHAWKKYLFAMMASRLDSQVVAPARESLPDFLVLEVRQLGFPPELPISSLVNFALRHEGRTLLPRRLALADRTSSTTRFWDLLDSLVREPDPW